MMFLQSLGNALDYQSFPFCSSVASGHELDSTIILIRVT